MGNRLSSKEEIIERLRKSLDLTLYEAKLYMALLENAKDPKEASAKSGVPLPRIYDIIKVLERKGMAVSDPDGWYRAVHPRGVAISAIAKIEEESKRKAREILEVADNLESFASMERGKGVILIKGYYNLVSLVVEIMKEEDIVYITAPDILSNWEEVLKPLVKSIVPLVNDLRVIVEEVNELNEKLIEEGKEIGISVRRHKPLVLDMISSSSAYVVVMRNREGIVGILQEDEVESRGVFDRIGLMWS